MKSDNPQTISKTVWYYETDFQYLEFVHQCYDASGNYLKTDIIKVPIKKLIKSLERMGYEIT